MLPFCERAVCPIALGAAAAVLLAGCWRSPPAAPPALPVKAAAAKVTPAQAEAGPSTELLPDIGAAEDKAAAETERKAAGDADASSSKASDPTTVAAVESARPVSKERILLLAPQNPILIELQLSIDGGPHTAAMEKLVDHVLKLADADGDGRTMWKELCASSKIKYGQYGNLAIDNENSEKQIIDRYDTSRDGFVGREELPRFLTRNAGSARPFSIRGTFDYRDRNRRAAPTWQVIDADDDGTISASERQRSGAQLAGRDLDDDEILQPVELNPRLQMRMPGDEMMDMRRRRGSTAAYLLGEHADWSGVQLALEQEYAGGRYVREDSFPLTPELFTLLDENKDGRLRRDEFRGLDAAPAHVVVAVAFGREGSGFGHPEGTRGSDQSGQEARDREQGTESEKTVAAPRVKLLSVLPAIAGESAETVEQPGRLTVAVGTILLTVYTNDTVASDNFSAQAKQALAMYDQNKDGYLVKEEVPENLQGQFGRFEAVDMDEDGKAYAEEIEEFLGQQQAGLRAQIHSKAGDQDDALFMVLDADGDQRLDSREMEGAAQRLARLDRSGEGNVTPDELPEMLVLGLARGRIENADALFTAPPAAVRQADASAPRWFTAMDANSDGAISQREFLGTVGKFGELDRDGNGLLELGEAEQSNPMR